MQFHEVSDWTPRNPMSQLYTTARKETTMPVAARFDQILWSYHSKGYLDFCFISAFKHSTETITFID